MSVRRITNASRRPFQRGASSPVAAYSPTSDDFSGASVDPKWTLTDPSNALLSAPYQSGGSLFMPHNGTTATNYMSFSPFQNAPRLTQPLSPGDADVRLLLTKQPKQTRFLHRLLLKPHHSRQLATCADDAEPDPCAHACLRGPFIATRESGPVVTHEFNDWTAVPP